MHAQTQDQKHEDLLKRIQFLEETIRKVHPQQAGEVKELFNHDFVEGDPELIKLLYMPH